MWGVLKRVDMVLTVQAILALHIHSVSHSPMCREWLKSWSHKINKAGRISREALFVKLALVPAKDEEGNSSPQGMNAP
jgi:hypothetical protein